MSQAYTIMLTIDGKTAKVYLPVEPPKPQPTRRYTRTDKQMQMKALGAA